MRNHLYPILITLALSGCANPINERTAQRYYAAGEESIARGNLSLAKENFRRTLININAGNLGPAYEAQAAAKLARVLGNLCEYEEAEKTFHFALSSKVKQMGESSPATFPIRIELAQLAFDTKRYEKAVGYFAQAFPVADPLLEKNAPSDYADMLTDYATALRRTGREFEADEISRQAQMLRDKAQPSSKGPSGYVPYPQSCK